MSKQETIIRALSSYRAYMLGLSRVNHTAGHTEYADYCTIEAHNAQEALKELQGVTQ